MEEVKEKARFGAVYTAECFRLCDPVTHKRFRDAGGKFLPRQLIWTEIAHNVVTAQGINSILNVMFHNATQIATWYCVISETDTAGADGLTYAVPSFTETESYDEATRPEYVEAEGAAKAITNAASKAVFTISATKTLYGAGLVGGGTDPTVKSDAAGGGTLFSYAKFGTERAVVDDDVVNLTIALGGADDGA